MIEGEHSTGADSGDHGLLSDDFAQLEQALNRALAADSSLGDSPEPTAFRPVAIFAEAWLVCGFDAAAGELTDDWSTAFTPEERAELECELPDPGQRPLIRFLHPQDASPVMVLLLPVGPYAHWPMVERWLAGRASGVVPGHVALRLAALDPRQDRFNRARTIFRLTPSEERLVCRLAQSGTLREAARREGVTYETARTALKAALGKSGHPRQPALVGAALKLGALDEPLELASEAPLREVFGLTARQASIARLFALGQTRDELARQLGLSVETVKGELKVIYATLGVGNATALAAISAQVGAAARMLAAQMVGGVDLAASSEPVRLMPRLDRPGRIAFADYGPPSRIPTFHLHTATTSRYLPRSYVTALQAAGLRPVAIDRPGFGMTEMSEGNHFEQTALDLLDVADALGADRFNVIARGASPVGWLLAHHRSRVERMVITNPEPAPATDHRMSGIQGAYKRVFYSLPALIVPLANQLANHVSDRMIERLIDKFLGSSAADKAVLADPEMLRAHIHANRLAALQGGRGLAAVGMAEPRALIPPIADGSFITVLCGLQDPMYRPEDSLPRLEQAWPGMTVRLVADAGRLLHLQHPEMIAAELTSRSRLAAPRRQSQNPAEVRPACPVPVS
ncbi:MAG: LuxR C-terminal-related transcriptional regulator [Novosphingobium sp.]